MQELKSCPFCGGEAEIAEQIADKWTMRRTYSAQCCNRDCQAVSDYYLDKADAIAWWNRRADDADRARLVAQVEKLQADKVIDPLQIPPEPIECPWCHSKYAPRLYGWHERTEDGRNVNTRYTVRCLTCGAQGPKKEIGPHAIDAWNRRADDADRARLVAQVSELTKWKETAMRDLKMTIEANQSQQRVIRNEREHVERLAGENTRLVAQVEWLNQELSEKQKYILQLERNGSNLEQQLATLQAATPVAAGAGVSDENVLHWVDVVTTAVLDRQDEWRSEVGIAASALVDWMLEQRQEMERSHG